MIDRLLVLELVFFLSRSWNLQYFSSLNRSLFRVIISSSLVLEGNAAGIGLRMSFDLTELGIVGKYIR